MPKLKLEQLLQQWFQKETTSAPLEDDRRSEQCLRFSELQEAVDPQSVLAIQKRSHIETCAWCSRAVSSMQQELREQLVNSAPSGAVSEALREYVAQWLIQYEAKPGESAPVSFDAAGTLHISLSGLSLAGAVHIRMVAGTFDLLDVDAEIVQGNLEISQPMAHWGLRNLRLTAEAVKMLPLAS